MAITKKQPTNHYYPTIFKTIRKIIVKAMKSGDKKERVVFQKLKI
jgi:hypothetical protein